MVWNGATGHEPEDGTVPMPLSIVTAAAPLTFQESVVDWPGAMLEGEAVKAAMDGALVPATVTVVLLTMLPPLLVAVSV